MELLFLVITSAFLSCEEEISQLADVWNGPRSYIAKYEILYDYYKPTTVSKYTILMTSTVLNVVNVYLFVLCTQK